MSAPSWKKHINLYKITFSANIRKLANEHIRLVLNHQFEFWKNHITEELLERTQKC